MIVPGHPGNPRHIAGRRQITPIINTKTIMQFVITAYDGEGMLDRRMAVRPRHLEGMARLGAHVVCAGGLLDESGTMKGSVLVMEFQDRRELDEYIANEPYVVEHVWEKIEVERMNVVLLKGDKYAG